jgi:WWE domain
LVLRLRGGGAPENEMGMAAGGLMSQKIYPDNEHSTRDWDQDAAVTVYIHTVNSEVWTELTGLAMPSTPCDVANYNYAGLPWFSIYDDHLGDIDPSDVLGSVPSYGGAQTSESAETVQAQLVAQNEHGTYTGPAWQWKDDGGWTSYDDHTSTVIEAAFKAFREDDGVDSVDLTHGWFASGGGYTVSFPRMRQRKKATGFKRDVRRIALPDDTLAAMEPNAGGEVVALGSGLPALGGSADWQWRDDDGWKSYDAETSAVVEAAYAKCQAVGGSGPNTVELSHGFFLTRGGYVIDFAKHEQTKKSTGFVRRVRRRAATASAASGQSMDSVMSAAEDGRVQWLWWDNSNFVPYDVNTMRILEAAHATGDTKTTLNHGHFGSGGGYAINFEKMQQKKLSTGFVRRVQRKVVEQAQQE